MALALSKALRNHVLTYGSLKNALQGGVIKVFSGAAPADADAAETGTLLFTLTAGGSGWTPETISTGTVTLTGGAAGQITQVSVNGINLLSAPVPFNTSLNQTAIDLATAINEGQSSPEYRALPSGAVVTIYAMPGTGAGPNTLVVATTLVTITTTTANFSGGVTAVNGLLFSSAAAGVISKMSSQVWTGTAIAGGTASYWRFYTENGDAGAIDAAERYRRMQGDVGTAGTPLILPSTTVSLGTTQPVNTFTITAPAS